MKEKKDLDYYMGLNYNVIVSKRNDLYYVSLPELLLVEKGKTLNEAYEKLEKEKVDFFEKALAVGTENIIKEPTYLLQRKKRFSELFVDLQLLLTKISIISIVIGIIIYIFTSILIGKISSEVNEIVSQNINRTTQELNQVALSGMKHFEERINRHVDKYSTISEIQKERTRLRLRKYVQQVIPLIDEIIILWEEESNKKSGDD